MAKVHRVENAQVLAANIELDAATPIVPLRSVYVRLHAPTTDELALPWEGPALALHLDLVKQLAQDLLESVR